MSIAKIAYRHLSSGNATSMRYCGGEQTCMPHQATGGAAVGAGVYRAGSSCPLCIFGSTSAERLG